MATGHTDPRRRERILAAALELIAEEGVVGVSHRKVATRADVPLGSTTYHFTGMDDLLRQAFTRFADHIVAVFERRLGRAETPDPARQLDALIEGMTLHRALDDVPHDRALTRRAVDRVTAGWPTPAGHTGSSGSGTVPPHGRTT
ncbi:TetR/AcrR family transcriptional regulator [Streptomyces sp. NRRL S-31]|uniref:TetR/AcrR family transcriptional regulator n=1 Tax=Streptomyces sp. NRRL S-31 TaxID=1463898 RepID=UPI0007C6D76D|nr:TetR family transcriptional regulator [Streptomyces sp. NRRL S-31]